MEACSDKIEAVTGVRPTLIRPPYGEYNDTVISAIRSIGMEPIQWDVDGSKTASSIAQRIYMGVLPGIRTETGEPLFCTKREHFCVVDVPVPTALRAAPRGTETNLDHSIIHKCSLPDFAHMVFRTPLPLGV